MFRTLAYLELEAFSEPWYTQNLRHIQNTAKHLRWDVLRKWLPKAISGLTPQNFFLKKSTLKNFLIFQQMELSYISGNRVF